MLEGWLRDHGTLEAAAAAHPGAELLTGRGRVYAVPSPVRRAEARETAGGSVAGGSAAGEGERRSDGERWVVRHYHRGGAIAPILGDRYLRWGTPRPVRELEIGREVEARGVPTPAHLAAAVYPSGIWYRGDLVTRHVPDSLDLAAVLFPGGSLQGPATSDGARSGDTTDRAEAAMEAAGRLFRQIHEAGIDHPDLNLKNILIRGTGPELEALVLDLDGARVGDGSPVGDRARRRMIARFWRSGRKWERATGSELGPALAAAFEAGYLG